MVEKNLAIPFQEMAKKKEAVPVLRQPLFL